MAEPPAPVVVAPIFAVLAIVLVAWTAYLAYSLPHRHLARNWDVAWTGFDAALAVVLLLVAYSALRRRVWVQSAASAAATLLLVDAWFDVLTASPGADRLESLLLSLTSELPLALLCLWVAHHAQRASRP